MSLRTFFHSKDRRFRDALDAQDFAAASRLLEAGYDPEGESFIALARKGSKENLEIFFRKNDWAFAPLSVVNLCLVANLSERVDMLLGMGFDFNFDFYQNHPLKNVFACGADRQKKLEWLEKMTAGGIDRIANREEFLFDAIKHDFPKVADLAVRCGINPRQDDERFLHYAAQLQKKDMCLYLIEKPGADLERAVLKAVFGKSLEALQFLSELQAELKPASSEKPVTIETLSQDIKALRAMVAELTQKLEQQQTPPVLRLDKNSSTSPQP